MQAGVSALNSQGSGIEYMQKEISSLVERLVELEKDYTTVADINRQETQAALAAKERLVPLAVLQIADAFLCLENYAAERWQAVADQLSAACS